MEYGVYGGCLLCPLYPLLIGTIFRSSCVSSASFCRVSSLTIILFKVIVGYHHHYYTNVASNVPFISN